LQHNDNIMVNVIAKRAQMQGLRRIAAAIAWVVTGALARTGYA